MAFPGSMGLWSTHSQDAAIGAARRLLLGKASYGFHSVDHSAASIHGASKGLFT